MTSKDAFFGTKGQAECLVTHRPLVTELDNLIGLEIMSKGMTVCVVGSKKSRFADWRHE